MKNLNFKKQEVKTLHTSINYAIIAEISLAVEKLGGKSGLLSIIGSWGDTLSDNEVLDLLKDYNNTKKDAGSLPIKKKPTPESSQVVSLEYDPNIKQLTVEFKNGTYDYTPVPEAVADEAWAAESIGKFINTIKNRYNCKKR